MNAHYAILCHVMHKWSIQGRVSLTINVTPEWKHFKFIWETFWKLNTKLLVFGRKEFKKQKTVNLRKVPMNDINSLSFPILTSKLCYPIHFLHRSTFSSWPTLKMVYFIYEQKYIFKNDISWCVRGDGCVAGLRRAWLPRFANIWRRCELLRRMNSVSKLFCLLFVRRFGCKVCCKL